MQRRLGPGALQPWGEVAVNSLCCASVTVSLVQESEVHLGSFGYAKTAACDKFNHL
jgi:hypothetical protein